MAMRVSYLWHQTANRNYGWSENFWNTVNTFEAAEPLALKLRDILMGIHGFTAVQGNIRLQMTTAPFLTRLLRYPRTGNQAVADTDLADLPTTALLLECTNEDGRTVRQWLRGIWDDVIKVSGIYTPTADFIGRITALYNELTRGAAGWSLRTKDKAQAKKVIETLTATGLATVTGHGYQEGDKVRIYNSGMIRVDHMWRVTVPTANTFRLAGWTELNGLRPYNLVGLVQKYVPVYDAIKRAIVDISASHKTGRPFGLPSGRRRVKL